MLNKLRKQLRENKILHSIYDILYGNKKALKEISQKTIELQSEGIQYLLKVDSALTESGITYYLDFGTLLGLVRDGKFIAYDCDLDCGVIDEEGFSWDKFERIMCNAGFRKYHQFRLNGNITEQTYVFEKNKLSIDSFLHNDDGLTSRAYLYYKDESYDYKAIDDMHVALFTLKSITGIKRLKVDGGYVNIPQNVEEYLESIYSENWRTPDPDWDHLKSEATTLLGTIERMERFV